MYLRSDYLLRVFVFCQALLISLQRDARSLKNSKCLFYLLQSIFYILGVFIKFETGDCVRVKENCVSEVAIN